MLQKPGDDNTCEFEKDPVVNDISDASEDVAKELSPIFLDEQTEEIAESGNDTSKAKYLYYGGKGYPKGIDPENTLKFLSKCLKYTGGELHQARINKDGSAVVREPEEASEVCSYCGIPISGVDYYKLPDGRKRCTKCSRSLVGSLEELNDLFNDIVTNMELFFEATLDVPVKVEMIEERKLLKKIHHGLSQPPQNVLILGVAVEHKKTYTIYVENAIPRASLIATVAHELTHIWQYTHWNRKQMKKRYGAKNLLEVYEGMAKWVEVQYLYHIGENTMAKREELITLTRDDEYGRGFVRYVDKYPLSSRTKAFLETPFSLLQEPLD